MSWTFDSPWRLFAVCLVSGLLVPLPEDLTLVLAGWALRQGKLELLPTLLAAFLGVLARDTIAFSVGYYLERWLERRSLGRRLLASRRVGRARELFQKHGWGMLLATRFAVGMRPPLYLAAGLVGHSYRVFWLADGAGLLITTPLCLGLGWYFGEEAARTLEGALLHQRWILAIGVGFLLYRWLSRWRSRRRALARAIGDQG